MQRITYRKAEPGRLLPVGRWMPISSKYFHCMNGRPEKVMIHFPLFSQKRKLQRGCVKLYSMDENICLCS